MKSLKEQLEIDRQNIHDTTYGSGVQAVITTGEQVDTANCHFFTPLTKDDTHGYEKYYKNPYAVFESSAVSGVSFLVDSTTIEIDSVTWRVRKVTPEHAGRITVYVK